MAETASKRQREEEQEISDNKRHKSFNHILSLLDEEEEEPNQDISSLITTLQEEISFSASSDSSLLSPPGHAFENDREIHPSEPVSSSSSSSPVEEDENSENERALRHLLEASDDELGIPNSTEVTQFVLDDGIVEFSSDALWELEDEAANYYALLQCELFM